MIETDTDRSTRASLARKRTLLVHRSRGLEEPGSQGGHSEDDPAGGPMIRQTGTHQDDKEGHVAYGISTTDRGGGTGSRRTRNDSGSRSGGSPAGRLHRGHPRQDRASSTAASSSRPVQRDVRTSAPRLAWQLPALAGCAPCGATTAVAPGGQQALVSTASPAAPGSSLRFRATFGGQDNQHVGFGVGLRRRRRGRSSARQRTSTACRHCAHAGTEIPWTAEIPLTITPGAHDLPDRLERLSGIKFYVDGRRCAEHTDPFVTIRS